MDFVTARFAMDSTEGWAVVSPAPTNLLWDLNASDGDTVTGPPCGRWSWGDGVIFDETCIVWSGVYTFEQLGVPPGSTVRTLSCPSYNKKDSTQAGTVSARFTMDVISGGVIVPYGDGPVIGRNLTIGVVDPSFANDGSGTSVHIPFLASNTPIQMQLSLRVVDTDGITQPSGFSEIDTVDIQIGFNSGGPLIPSIPATFNLITGEAWAEVGDTPTISYAQDPSNGQPLPCGKFSWDSTSAFASRFERARTKIYTWEDLGVPVGATVLTVTCDSFYWRMSVSVDSGFSASSNLDVVSAAGVIVHSVGTLDLNTLPGGPSTPWAQRLPGVSRAVDVAYRASNTQVKMQAKCTVANPNGLGEPDYYEFDTIVLTITYSLGGINGWIYSSISWAQGHGSDT